MEPRKPDPQRDLHTPVFVFRAFVFIIFVGLWVYLLPIISMTSGPSTAFGSRPTFSFLGLLFYGGPIFLITFVLAMCAWESAWTSQLSAYNAQVDIWNAYHAKIRHERERVEQMRAQEQARLAELRSEVHQLESQLEAVRKRRAELNR